MTNKLVDNIYEVAKNFKDPVTNLHLDQNNKNIDVLCNNGNVSISLSIDSKFKEKYQNLIIDLKKAIQKLDNIF